MREEERSRLAISEKDIGTLENEGSTVLMFDKTWDTETVLSVVSELVLARFGYKIYSNGEHKDELNDLLYVSIQQKDAVS